MSKNLIRGVKAQGDRHDDGVAGHRVVHDGHDQAPTASADGDAIPSCADQAGQDAHDNQAGQDDEDNQDDET